MVNWEMSGYKNAKASTAKITVLGLDLGLGMGNTCYLEDCSWTWTHVLNEIDSRCSSALHPLIFKCDCDFILFSEQKCAVLLDMR